MDYSKLFNEEKNTNLIQFIDSLSDLLLIVSANGNVLFSQPKVKDTEPHFDALFSIIGGDSFANFVNRNNATKNTLHLISKTEKQLYSAQIGKNPFDTDRSFIISAMQANRSLTNIFAPSFHNILDTVPDSVVIIDSKGIVQNVNKAFCSMFGFCNEDIVNKNISKIMQGQHKEKHDEYIANYLSSGRSSVVGTIRNIFAFHKKGTAIPVELSMSEFKIFDQRFFTGIIRNVSSEIDYEDRIKEHQDDLIKAKEAAEQAAKSKEKFLANMSHEIRTPLNAIVGMSEVLRRSQLNNEQKYKLDIITKSAHHLVLIINDILDLIKFEKGEFRLEEKAFRITNVVESAVAIQQIDANEKQLEINIRWNIPDKNLITIGDPLRLNQILSNLLNNAVKFTNQGSIDTIIEILMENEDTVTLQFCIRDTGIGIEKDKLEQIFGTFTQTDTINTGTGLGLALCKKIIEVQGGKIMVSSEQGKGAAFTFYVPYKKGKVKDVATDIDSDSEIAKDLNGLRVLLAEDMEFNRQVVISYLKPFGCIIDEAANGKIALDKINRAKYDVVLMDIQMPEMDGLETVKYIRQMQSDISKIPVIALTAFGLTGNKEKFMDAGMNDFISKPFVRNELIQKLYLHIYKRYISIEDDNFSLSNHANSETKSWFNLDQIHAIAATNKNHAVRMLRIFIDKTKEALTEMSKATNSMDFRKISFNSHKLKPSFATLNMTEILDDIYDIEQAARIGENMDEISQKIKKLENILPLIFEALENEINLLINK